MKIHLSILPTALKIHEKLNIQFIMFYEKNMLMRKEKKEVKKRNTLNADVMIKDRKLIPYSSLNELFRELTHLIK